MVFRLERPHVRSLLVLTVALFFSAVVVRPTLAKECPVTIDDFYLMSLGASRGLAQYQNGLSSAGNGPATIRFDVDDNGVTSSRTVLAANVDFESHSPLMLEGKPVPSPSADIAFVWPSKDVSAVAVREVIFSDSKLPIKCDTGWAPLTRAGLTQTEWRFDDRSVKLGPEITASAVTVAKFKQQVQPEYPEGAKEHGIQGSATVGVMLDESGKLMQSWVLKSSGSDLLDKASLSAAKASTYKAPMAESQPIVGAFVIYYIFELR